MAGCLRYAATGLGSCRIARPDGAIRHLSGAFSAAARDPTMEASLRTLGFPPIGDGPDDYAANLRVEIACWAELIRRANIRPD